MVLMVDVISDVICPWCFIGKRRLEKATTALAGKQEIRVRRHPFSLNPQMPRGGMDRKAYRTAKFGSWVRSQALDNQVAAIGATEGLVFAFGKIKRTLNTLDAHRLIRLAGQDGGVPFFIVNGELALSGPQEPARFLEAFECASHDPGGKPSC